MRLRRLALLPLAVLLLCTLAAAAYNLPPVHDRLAWRVAAWRSEIYRRINPPEKAVFAPYAGGPAAETAALHTPELVDLDPTADLAPTPSPDLVDLVPTKTVVTSEAAPPTATPTPTPLPARVALPGIRHEQQTFNNCGPATLSMALSYWNWPGDQHAARAALRPHADDYNVMPEEMAAFVQESAGLKALVRPGGDIDLLKRLVAAGFPVLVEKGMHPSYDSWMGHYVLVSGYDDEQGVFITQDSYVSADNPVPYEGLSERWWRDFNYVYLVIFTPDLEERALDLLGPHAGPVESYRLALAKAEQEIQVLEGRDLFFAWYNKGANLVALQDYPAAAEAYDQAFSIYNSLPEAERPWRMLWYQIGPYPAYYHTGRYQAVIDLATRVLGFLNTGGLEESNYWRGLAKDALGDRDGALADFKRAVWLNSNFQPALEALAERGVSIP